MKYMADLLENMTIRQKILLCSGWGSNSTIPLDDPQIESFSFSYAQNGLCRQTKHSKFLFTDKDLTAVCFPSPNAFGCTWNEELAELAGGSVGEEARSYGTDAVIIPSPAVKRSPLYGKNANLYSEDPLLNRNLCVSYATGIKSKGTAIIVDSLGIENNESLRVQRNYIVDKRTLVESYFWSIGEIIKSVDPVGFVYSSSMLNGEKLSEIDIFNENSYLSRFDFDGLLFTPWMSCGDPVASIKAGVMPEFVNEPQINVGLLTEAIYDQRLSEDDLDNIIGKMIFIFNKIEDNKNTVFLHDNIINSSIALSCARESFVLLKNEDKKLPLKRDINVLVLGEGALKPKIQVLGRAYVNPSEDCSPLKAIKRYAEVDYFSKISEVNKSSHYDAVIYFAKVNDDEEAEGIDREGLALNINQSDEILLIREFAEKSIVVVSSGGPVEMPWIDNVDCVLYDPITGQSGGLALAEILFGETNPSGRLNQTFCSSYKDAPSYNYSGTQSINIILQECVYNGYRYYSSCNKDVLFPFGYGLSYSNFNYSDFDVSVVDQDGFINIEFTITNDSDVDGFEISQIYITDNNQRIFKPGLELKDYRKTFIKAHESKTIKYRLHQSQFSHFDVRIGQFVTYSSNFRISIAASANDIKFSEIRYLLSESPFSQHHKKEQLPSYFELKNKELRLPNLEYRDIYADKLPVLSRSGMFSEESTLKEISLLKSVSKFSSSFRQAIGITDESIEESPNLLSLMSLLEDTPLSALNYYYPNIYTLQAHEKVIKLLNKENARIEF